MTDYYQHIVTNGSDLEVEYKPYIGSLGPDLTDHSPTDSNLGYAIAANMAQDYRRQAYDYHNHYNHHFNSSNQSFDNPYNESTTYWTPTYASTSTSYTGYYETQKTYGLETYEPDCSYIPTSVKELDVKLPSSSVSSSQTSSSSSQELVMTLNHSLNHNYMSRQCVVPNNQWATTGYPTGLTMNTTVGTSGGTQAMNKPVVRRRRRGGLWRLNMTYEQMREEKRESNRQAAHRCRQKKLDALSVLEKDIKGLIKSNDNFEHDLTQYRQVIEMTKIALLRHQIMECVLQRND